MVRARWWVAPAMAAVLCGLAGGPASAQYFGRNKVQFRTFSFEVLRTAHFDVYFYADERAAAQQAARMAERWYERLSRIFTHQLVDRQPLILYASHPDFEQTNVVEGELGEGTGGVTEGLKGRIVLPLGSSLAESDHVIGHELVHAFQYDITNVRGAVRGSSSGGLELLPLWFIEGMAEFLSIGPVDPNTAMWMRDAASQKTMPSIRDLANQRYFPYRWGQALWAYLAGRYGDSVVGAMLRTGAAAGGAEVAIRAVLGVENIDTLSQEWQQALRSQATEVRQQTTRITDTARPLQRGSSELDAYNISPALSPDGRRLMFLSQRNVVSIDLYLADAETGKVLRKVVDGAFDPHFSSLGFINSAGAWSPDSRRFAFAAVRAGTPHLVILDVDAHKTEREVPFRELGEILSPAWSPDGTAIAFTGHQGGWTDLFVYDLASGKSRRLTHDAFADLQPVWDPSGTSLVFVSDRFATRLSDLATGAYQLVALDLASGRMRAIPGAETGKNINPQWGRDGQLYFVSDRTGISNIYRVDADGGNVVQMTNVLTGVSGITPLSPAISLAPAVNRIAFSIYENGKFDIYAMNVSRIAEELPPAMPPALEPARLPPARRASSEIVRLQQDVALGLPPAADVPSTPFDRRLQLDMIGQPYVTAGVDPYGMSFGGGLALFWSDMLGDYKLGTAVQVNQSFSGDWRNFVRSIGGQVAFENRRHRWNYGLVGGQLPYLASLYSLNVSNAGGSPVGVEQVVTYRQVERTVSAVASCPLNAAQRIEVGAGLLNISFDQQIWTTTFDLGTGRVLSDTRQTVPGPETLNLAQASASLVYDTVRYGATSPIAGQAYRLQVTPTVGTLRYSSVLADYRRYVMPVSFYTIAGRIVHYGRYGRSSEDSRLIPTSLGYPNLVRGYDTYSAATVGCTGPTSASCAQYDRLLGSRVLVANLEFRFPLLRPFGVRPDMYGPLPIELAVFADAGVAWNSGQKPAVFGGDREGVSSAGVAVRTRILGALVLEFDVARPFQRPGTGWVFQFNLSPGF